MNTNTWRQPIPINIYDIFGEDYACLNLYIHLLLRACNDHQVIKLGKKIITLERGESLFGRRSLSKFISMSPSGTEKALQRLEKMHKKVTCKVTSNYTIVSIVNYEEVVCMKRCEEPVKKPVSNQLETSEKPVSNTHKSVRVKSDRVEDTDKVETESSFKPEIKIVLDKYNEVFKKRATSSRAWEDNFFYWRKYHPLEDILTAIEAMHEDEYWKKIIDLEILFRQTDQDKRPVDRIEKFFLSAKQNPKVPQKVYKPEDHAEGDF